MYELSGREASNTTSSVGVSSVNGIGAGTTDSSTTSPNVVATISITAAFTALLAIFFVVMLVMALLAPRLPVAERVESKEARKEKRVEALNNAIASQKFRDWRTKQIDQHPELVISTEPLCVICLETIEDKALIRGLSCHHVYHQQCLDNWYGGCHEYCPLCHRLILPTKPSVGGHTDNRTTELERENVTEVPALIA